MAKAGRIQYTQSPASADREAFIQRQTELHEFRIQRAQSRFWRLLRDGLLSGLLTDDSGAIQRTPDTASLGGKIDDIFRQWQTDEIEPIIAKLSAGMDGLLTKNAAYFASVKENTADDNVRSSTLGILGIAGSVLLPGSPLISVLRDPEALNTIKSTILSAVLGGVTITALKIAVEEIVTRVDGGIVKKLFDRVLPDPFITVDRQIGRTYAVALELNHAIYQGGLIGTSRPFCRERNNRVFTRDEIARFGTPADQYGGYENKSTGHFQGKPKQGYNPFTMCGGFNCRHQLDYISDELAYALRPDLRP